MIARSEVTLGDTAVYLGNPLPKHELQVQPRLTLFKNVQAAGARELPRRLQDAEQHGSLPLCVRAELPRDQRSDVCAARDQAAAIAALLTTDAGYIQDASFTRLREVSMTVERAEALGLGDKGGGA